MTLTESANVAENSKTLQYDEAILDNQAIYLVFDLMGESCGLDVSEVLSIVLVPPNITRVPNAPYYVRGVMNLRGTIIPVLDCGLKLGGAAAVVKQDSRVVVAEIDDVQFGVMVDAVREVRSVFDSQVEKPDSAKSSFLSAEYVYGIAKMDDGGLLVLLDLAKVFDLEELLEQEEEVLI